MRRSLLRRALLATTALVVSLTGALALGDGAAQATHFVPAPIGSDGFYGGQSYSGDFPDPSILRIGTRYYAYSTTIANKNLPVLTSTNLQTWTAFSGGTSDDAFPRVPTWADYQTLGSRRVAPTWAPSVRPVAGGYAHAYATRLRGTSKFCISLSHSSSPTGPFVDTSSGPKVCPSDEGAIDPYLWRDNGKLFMLFKTEGIRGVRPTRLFIRRMKIDGTGFAEGSYSTELLRTAPNSWEGNVIENPAMFHYLDQYYLFYSANDYATDKYAVGYALCDGPKGPCRRPSSDPLLHTTGSIAGPGGESPFLDANGIFRLAYHAWTTGHVGYPTNDSCRSSNTCPQRRLRVAHLAANPDHTLRVLSYVVQ